MAQFYPPNLLNLHCCNVILNTARTYLYFVHVMLIAALEGELSLSPVMMTWLCCPLWVWQFFYAFPGRRECWACVESSTLSWSFEAGWMVSWWRLRWLPSSAILPGGAWGDNKIVDRTFYCQKQILSPFPHSSNSSFPPGSVVELVASRTPSPFRQTQW